MVNSLGFQELINARITLPLNFEMNEDRNLLAKIVNYRYVSVFKTHSTPRGNGNKNTREKGE